MDSIGSRVQEIRKAQGLTQSQFAEEMAISQAHVSKIEKGAERPSPTLIRLIALKYKVDEEWLNNGDEKASQVLMSSDNAMFTKQVDRLVGQIASSDASDAALIVDAVDNLVMILTVPNGFPEAKLSDTDKHKYLLFVQKTLVYMWKLIASVTLRKPLLPTSSAQEWLLFKSKSEKLLGNMCNSAREATNTFLTELDEVFRL